MLPLTILALALSAGALGATEKSASDESIRLATEHLLGSSVRSRSANPQYRFRKAHVDKKGDTHVRFSQHINGVRVWGSEAITHMDSRKVFNEDTFKIHEGVQLNTQATLSESEALAKVSVNSASRGYAQQPAIEKVIYPVTAQQFHRFMTQEGQTPNAMEVSREVSSYHLAYHVKTVENSPEGFKSTEYMVDAHTGRILNQWSGLRTATPAKGTGNSRFDGKVSLDTAQVAPGQFELRDLTRSTQPQTLTGEMGNAVYDLENQEFTDKLFAGKPYTDTDNTWGDGQNYDNNNGTQSANGQTAAVDVAHGVQSAWDYYKAVHGRDGFDGKGTATFANVHFGMNVANAFWFDACNCMGFGDDAVGKPTDTTLDTVAHEFSHGFCFHSANLVYQDEMGGLNEANSDIMATMVEHWVRGGKKGSIVPDTAPRADWELFKDAGEAGRFMYKPSLDDKSLEWGYPHPLYWGRYSLDAWSPEMRYVDVHFNSGPMNRAFYFLSCGATTTGDTSAPDYLPKGMKGIGNTNAARLWYGAMTTYMTPMSMYVDARAAMLRVANELETFEPYQGRRITRKDAIEAVQNAFAGINVGLSADKLCMDTQAPVMSDLEVKGNTGDITFQVGVRDNRQVTLVEFYVDDLLVGTGKRSLDCYTLKYDSAKSGNGSHSISAKAYDAVGNIAYTEMQEFEVSNDSCELLHNNSFEQGNLWWMYSDPEITSSDKAFEGKHFITLGGFGHLTDLKTGKYTDYVVQGFYLPENIVSAQLTLWASVNSKEAPGVGDVDAATVMIANRRGEAVQVLGQISNEEANKGWKKFSFEVDAALAQSAQMEGPVFVQVISTENEGNSTKWALDNFSLVAHTKEQKNCLVNGDFESGTTAWFGDRQKIGAFPGIQPASGDQCLWLGGHEKSHQEQVYQMMNIPAAAEKVSLKFQLHIDTEEKTTKTPYDRLMVQVLDGSSVHTLATFSNLDAAKEYREVKLDLGAFKGRSIRLQFVAEEVGTRKTNFLLDNVSVNAQ